MNETIGTVIIAVGITFDFFGCVGMVRFPDVYTRLQAATKCVTLGTCLILLGVVVSAGGAGVEMGVKAIICGVFILVTSPTAAHALARGAYLSGVKLWEKSVVDRYSEERKGKGSSK